MTLWIVKNLWLIPALPLVAAGMPVLASRGDHEYTFGV